MTIYLINTVNNTIDCYENVKEWASNYILLHDSTYIHKIYCGDNEYFTDVLPEFNINE